LELLAEGDPVLARLVSAAERQGVFHAFPGQVGYMRQASGPGWALVGDAGFFKDPLTAHGMTDALRDAELLARAVVAGTEAAMTGYRAARDDMAREMLDVTDAIASFAWDLDEVKALHLRLSEHMTREQEFVAGFDARFGAAGGLAAPPRAKAA
jgi:flavin-dependent dehydrogenase